MNALTRGLELALTQQAVPYQIVRGLAFYDRKEIRDLLAYLRFLLNPRDEVSFEQRCRCPASRYQRRPSN
jgi:DNA helicase-2/ATP-dependent DNA helicase PcrA